MLIDKFWKIKPPSRLAQTLALDAGLSRLQAQLLINRGITDKKSVQSFLQLRLADIADPMLMKGMHSALPMIMSAAYNRELITIYGDFDADGLTATALLYNFFCSLDVPVSYYVPNRMDEGYGLNRKAIETISLAGTKLLISVDCGISNEREIAFAQSLGIKVIVTDHHQVPNVFIPRCPVINPHQPDCLFPFKDLAGVGVAFFLAIAVRAALREKGWFRTRPEPDLKEYLDLVALGTVADRVPLIGQNRILVNSGIEYMTGTRWIGMKAMKEVSDVSDSWLSAEDLAFKLAPRLNAPGRIGDPLLGVKVLTTQEPVAAKNYALRLNTANIRRQEIEREIYDAIEEKVASWGGIRDRKILFLGNETWHKGVLGIVASKLVEKYHRPSLIFSIRNGFAVGSGRSIDGLNLFQALSQLSHFFEKFGGHSHAAGFTLKTEDLREFEKQLVGLAEEMLTDKDLTPSIEVDAVLPLKEITPETIRQIRSLAPFGHGNPEPSFVARSLTVMESWIVGDRHLKLKVRAGGGQILEAIGFGLGGRYPLDGRAVDMVFTPQMNRWQGYDNIQLRIFDLKKTV